MKPRPQPADTPLLALRLTTFPGFSSVDVALLTNSQRRSRLDNRAEENGGTRRRISIRSCLQHPPCLGRPHQLQHHLEEPLLFRCGSLAPSPCHQSTSKPNVHCFFALYSQSRPGADAGCFSIPLLAFVGCLPSEGSVFLFCLSTGDIVGKGPTVPSAGKTYFDA